MKRRLRCQKGFLLVDAMVALTLLAIFVGGAGGVFALFKQAGDSHRQAESLVAAKQVAQRYLESWKALPQWYWQGKTEDDPAEWKTVSMKNLTGIDESGSFKESCILYKKNVDYTVDSLQVRVKTLPGQPENSSQLVEFRLKVSWKEGDVSQSWSEEMTCLRKID